MTKKYKLLLGGGLILVLAAGAVWALTLKPGAQTPRDIAQNTEPAPVFMDLPVQSKPNAVETSKPKFNSHDNLGLSAFALSDHVDIVKADCVLADGKHMKGELVIAKNTDPQTYQLIEVQTEKGLIRFARDQTKCTFK